MLSGCQGQLPDEKAVLVNAVVEIELQEAASRHLVFGGQQIFLLL
jgi:hypothetical protein